MMLRFLLPLVPVAMMFGRCIDRGRQVEMQCHKSEITAEEIPDEVTASWEGLKNFEGWWVITGCGTEAICPDDHPEAGACHESPTFEVVRERLSLETGCEASRIQIERKGEWRRGTERAYRLLACGGTFVCTTAAGKLTDCKTALPTIQAPNLAPPPPMPATP